MSLPHGERAWWEARLADLMAQRAEQASEGFVAHALKVRIAEARAALAVIDSKIPVSELA